jgi:transmembrane sensor
VNALQDSYPSLESQASELFVQRLHGEWLAEDQDALERRLSIDPEFAGAYQRVQASWGALDRHAESAEVMAYREEALSFARHSNARRWFKRSFTTGRARAAAALIGVAFLLGVAWELSPYAYVRGQYRTGIGEQRIIDLEDHSTIALDAATRLRVRYTPDARVVELLEGQAQFSVTKDPARPFKVEAGGRSIVAVGTVFTVEYVDSQVHVAMMEGKVAVVPTVDPATSPSDSAAREGISLSAGEELRVSRDGRSTVTAKADLEAATAWREGKVIIRSEPLGDAVQRMNRYSRLKIKIDDAALAAKNVSGVFAAGDTRGFVRAIELYLPVEAEYPDSDTVNLRLK